MEPMRRRLALLAAAALLAPWLPAAAAAQDDPPAASEEGAAEAPQPLVKPLLTIESVEVGAPEGKQLGPESLARLTVKLANHGKETASVLAFTVEVAEQELPVYRNQVFLKPVPPGEPVELALYNFWTGETGRPAPADGKLTVEVTLREARWVEVTQEEDTEVWTPGDPVAGLPVSASVTVALSGS